MDGVWKTEKIELWNGGSFDKIVKCKITKLCDQPLLVLQGDNFCIMGMVLDKKCRWVPKFTLRDEKLKLGGVFGQFLKVTDMKNRQAIMLEIGGKNKNQIVTRMLIDDKKNRDSF